jgi:hypothetical protein
MRVARARIVPNTAVERLFGMRERRVTSELG